MPTTLAERVAKGAAFLDARGEVGPDWIHEIDTDELSMSSAYTCVLGQLYGDFFAAIASYGWEVSAPIIDAHGFDLPGDEADDTPYNELTGAWRDLIFDRLRP